jgi:hypothetical protein
VAGAEEAAAASNSASETLFCRPGRARCARPGSFPRGHDAAEERLNQLAALLLTGAAGLVVGLWWRPAGVAAAGLVRLREKGEVMRWQPVTLELAAAVAEHARCRGAVLPTDAVLRSGTARR